MIIVILNFYNGNVDFVGCKDGTDTETAEEILTEKGYKISNIEYMITNYKNIQIGELLNEI